MLANDVQLYHCTHRSAQNKTIECKSRSTSNMKLCQPILICDVSISVCHYQNFSTRCSMFINSCSKVTKANWCIVIAIRYSNSDCCRLQTLELKQLLNTTSRFTVNLLTRKLGEPLSSTYATNEYDVSVS